MSVVIETTKGDLTVDLFTAERPKTCLNFLKLCKQKKYNMNLFHMIQNNFIAQTGDPTETGRGGESIFFDLYGDQAKYYEAETNPRIKHVKQGTLSMVNCGDNLLGSQFFLTLADDLDYLDGQHCVFGEVVEGFETLDVLNETICDGDNRPYQDIRITHTVVLHDPFQDPPGLEPRAESPEPSKELLASSRIGADENINDYAGKTDEEINEIIAEKEAKARATILEMVGDLPDADCAPPENVLFVCKLNPVTNDDDLEIIFSRFGKVKCCEVIRDRKTGDSLQYAFVEFEDTKPCEDAYFKMDNVLIDDRRIHVDFSQSVSKYHWKGKGRLEIKEEKEYKPEMKQKSLEKRPRSRSPIERRKERQVQKEGGRKERSPSRERRNGDNYRGKREEDYRRSDVSRRHEDDRRKYDKNREYQRRDDGGGRRRDDDRRRRDDDDRRRKDDGRRRDEERRKVDDDYQRRDDGSDRRRDNYKGKDDLDRRRDDRGDRRGYGDREEYDRRRIDERRRTGDDESRGKDERRKDYSRRDEDEKKALKEREKRKKKSKKSKYTSSDSSSDSSDSETEKRRKKSHKKKYKSESSD